LPYGRTAQLFEDLLDHYLSEAILVLMNQRCSDNLDSFIIQLTWTLSQQDVFHADETAYYYNAERNLLYMYLVTEKYTLYMPAY
jgi:hypothetical protein